MKLTLMAASFATTIAAIVVAIPTVKIRPSPYHLCLKLQQLVVKNFEPEIFVTFSPLLAITSFALP